jgi:hypothetical protein
VPFPLPRCATLLALPLLLAIAAAPPARAQEPERLTIDWNRTTIVSRTTPTLQAVVNPMLRRGSPIHDASFAALKDLGADFVRYVPWLPYPRLAVAELEPPAKGHTSWDFSLIDPLMQDFFAATAGHSTIVNFSTLPAWLYRTAKPVTWPADPNQVDWNYTQGTELVDPTGAQLGGYYARLVSWYTQGGFTDENGVRHTSGYHYSLPYWEVLNEVEAEHSMTPEQYTARYDAIVSAIHAVSPATKFMGLALADPSGEPQFFEYFLNHAHHRPGIPLDFISYHFYATPTREQTADQWQYTFFDQAERFLTTVRYIEAIRKRLSPETKTDADELGVILPTDNTPNDASIAIAPRYWNAAGALYAYLYLSLAQQGIEVAGESQLVGYPSQYPSVSMMDWKTAKPNARYWVLRLLHDHCHPGDTLIATTPGDADFAAQAFTATAGRAILLVNKRNRTVRIALPAGLAVRQVQVVDEASGEGPARTVAANGSTLELGPFAVMVAEMQ